MPNTITLYQYLHCPYCIRVRLALSYLAIPYKSVLLSYADEVTPVKLTGKKMAPILKRLDGTFINESLDIIHYVDLEGKLELKTPELSSAMPWVLQWIDQISKPLFNLLMPYYLNNLEFSDQDKKYFQAKKEIKRGSFTELVKKRDQFSHEVNAHLELLLPKLAPFINGENLSLLDILLTSHLWGLYFAHDYRVSEKLHQYLCLVAKTCNFTYDQDWWKK